MMDWNDYIENEGEITTLPEGDYEFTVTNFEKGQHAGSAKIPPCNKAILELTFRAPDGSRGKCKDFLLLHDSVEWKLCAFFLSIGLRKHGEKGRMAWDKILGRSGMCRIYVDEYEKNGKLEKRTVQVGKVLWGSYYEILSDLSEEDYLAFPYGKQVKQGAPTVESDLSVLYGY